MTMISALEQVATYCVLLNLERISIYIYEKRDISFASRIFVYFLVTHTHAYTYTYSHSQTTSNKKHVIKKCV